MAYGKIARLPRTIREQLNQRMADGEPGTELVDWLNSLPEVQVVMAEHFYGRAISAQNFSEWKQHGYQDWVVKQELVASTRDLAADAGEVKAALGDTSMTEHLAVLLGARYAKLLSSWDGTVDKGFLQQMQGLGRLCQQVATLRRSEQAAGRLKVQQALAEHTFKCGRVLALEAVLEDIKDQWPDVQEALAEVFQYYKERRGGGEIRPLHINTEWEVRNAECRN